MANDSTTPVSNIKLYFGWFFFENYFFFQQCVINTFNLILGWTLIAISIVIIRLVVVCTKPKKLTKLEIIVQDQETQTCLDPIERQIKTQEFLYELKHLVNTAKAKSG